MRTTATVERARSTHSVWRADHHNGHARAASMLRGQLTTDVVIVGAGIAGVTAALLLQRSGQQVALIEARHVGDGDSGRTTAHLTTLLDRRYCDLIDALGIDAVRLVARSGQQAIEQIAQLVHELQIDCDFQRVPAHVYAETPQQLRTLEHEAVSLQRLHIDTSWAPSPPFAPHSLGTLRVPHQAQLDPLRYLHALADAFVRAGGMLFEHTPMLALRDGTPCEVTTSHGMIRAHHALVLTHAPLEQPLSLQLKVAAYRTYALAARLPQSAPQLTDVSSRTSALYFDMHEPYHYLRMQRTTQGDLLIAGGGDHKVGQCDDTRDPHVQIEQYVRERFGDVHVLYRWSGQIIEPADGIPFIGRSPGAKRVYVGTGFSGTGITFGTLAASMLRDAVIGADNPWRALYAPDRFKLLAQAPRMLREGKDFPRLLAADRLVRRKHTPNELMAGDADVLRVDGKLVAAYRDGQGTLHQCSAICTHMACVVHWNAAERSWDCPCHGSRFDIDGHVLHGPATAPLAVITSSDVSHIPVPDVTEQPTHGAPRDLAWPQTPRDTT